MNKKKSLVTVLADRKHVQAAKQVFAGLYLDAGWNEDMMLLAHKDETGGIPEKELRWFRKRGISIKECEQISDYYLKGFNYKVMFDSLYLFTPEFKRWKTIIYIDADVIVTSSIDKMKNVKGFTAVRDYLANRRLKTQFLWEDKEESKETREKLKRRFNMESPAFNAGIFAFNTDIIKDETKKEMLDLLLEYKDVFRLRDQPLHNLYFNKDWKRLPRYFNYYYGTKLGWEKKDMNKAAMLHFVGEVKPWHRESNFYGVWKKNLERAENVGGIGKQKKKKTNHTKLKITILFNDILKQYRYRIKNNNQSFYDIKRNGKKDKKENIISKVARYRSVELANHMNIILFIASSKIIIRRLRNKTHHTIDKILTNLRN